MEINKEILNKAEKILKEKEYIDMCLSAHICPQCGDKLKIKDSHSAFSEYYCNCGYWYLD